MGQKKNTIIGVNGFKRVFFFIFLIKRKESDIIFRFILNFTPLSLYIYIYRLDSLISISILDSLISIPSQSSAYACTLEFQVEPFLVTGHLSPIADTDYKFDFVFVPRVDVESIHC